LGIHVDAAPAKDFRPERAFEGVAVSVPAAGQVTVPVSAAGQVAVTVAGIETQDRARDRDLTGRRAP